MSLDYAIMGFLYQKPMSGYDLKKTFDATVRHFWPADQSQIYKTLANLNNVGWVDLRVETHDGRPNSKIYSLTEPGRLALKEWMSKALPPMEMRMPWLIQLFFAGVLSDEDVIDLLKQFENNLQGQMTYIQEIIEESHTNGWPDSRDAFFQSMTLDFAYTMMGAFRGWAERTEKRVMDGEHLHLK